MLNDNIYDETYKTLNLYLYPRIANSLQSDHIFEKRRYQYFQVSSTVYLRISNIYRH